MEGPDNMVAAAGDIWINIPNEAQVVRIDTRRNRVAARFHVPSGCGQLAFGTGAVWVADGCSSRITRIEPRTNRVAARIDTGSASAYPIVFADGSVWVTTDDLRLIQIDPNSNTIVDSTSIAPASRPSGGPFFTYGEGAFWLSDSSGDRVLRLDRKP